jgi:hypothetical protein
MYDLKYRLKLFFVRCIIGVLISIALYYWWHPVAALVYALLWAVASDAGCVIATWIKKEGGHV